MNTAFVELEAARFTVGEHERWVQECSLELTTDYETDPDVRTDFSIFRGQSRWIGFDLVLRVPGLERGLARELLGADDVRLEGWSPLSNDSEYRFTYFAFPFARAEALDLRTATLVLRCDEDIRAGREWVLPNDVDLGFAVPQDETIVRTYCMAKVTSRPLEVALA